MKITKTGKWTISQDEEYWNNEKFNSKEEAIECGKDYKYGYPHEDFYVGQIYDIEFENNEFYDPGENIINGLYDILYEVCGECSESWYENISEEQEKELDKMINETVLNETVLKWIRKNNLQPDCYTIDDVELIIGDYDYEN